MFDRIRDLGVARLALLLSLFAVVVATAGNVTAIKTKSDLIESNCLAIEALKRQNRQEAQLSYERLDENFKLVDIRLTASARLRAKENLTRKLQSNQATEC